MKIDYAKAIKQLRCKMIYSQVEFAELLGVAFSTVNRWEQGKALPSYATIQKFNALCKEHAIKFEEQKGKEKKK